jgi:hypothetical protein
MTSRGVSSTLRRGLEFVRYALNTVWFGEPDRLPILRGINVQRDFSDKLNGAGRLLRTRGLHSFPRST